VTKRDRRKNNENSALKGIEHEIFKTHFPHLQPFTLTDRGIARGNGSGADFGRLGILFERWSRSPDLAVSNDENLGKPP